MSDPVKIDWRPIGECQQEGYWLVLCDGLPAVGRLVLVGSRRLWRDDLGDDHILQPDRFAANITLPQGCRLSDDG